MQTITRFYRTQDWHELSDTQLQYVYQLLDDDY